MQEVCYSSFYYAVVNVIYDNMMSRLILTLTKRFFDNQFKHFKLVDVVRYLVLNGLNHEISAVNKPKQIHPLPQREQFTKT